MKIYVWSNENEDGNSDFSTDVLFSTWGGYSSGQHSGGIVILAENKEQAVDIFMKKQNIKNIKTKRYLLRTGKEYEIKEGLYYFGDGDC